jgi:hypothetical protein
MPRRTIILLCALVGPAALARSPEPATTPDAGFPETVKTGYAWHDVGPSNAPAFADVAVQDVITAGNVPVVIAVDVEGGVWKTDDGARSWRRVLAALKGEDEAVDRNDVLYDVEDRLDDELSTEEPPETSDYEYDASDTTGDATDALQAAEDAAPEPVSPDDAIEQARAEVADVARHQAAAVPPRVWISHEGLVFVGRADGLWLSTDGGDRFERKTSEPATALIRGPENWILGTDDGVMISVDPLDWRGAERSLQGSAVRDLGSDGTVVEAAADDGLWHGSNGMRWLGEGVIDGAVDAVLVDPTSGREWLSTGDAIRVADDHGRTLVPPSGRSPSVRTFAWVGPDHVLAAGADGPWETVDGGKTWTPFTQGLLHRGASAITVAGGVAWLAADDGLYRLEPDDGSGPTAVSGEVDVRTLVDAALARPGVRHEHLGNRIIAGLLPTASVTAKYYPGVDLNYTAGDYSSHGQDGVWYAYVNASWTPKKSRKGGDFEPILVGDEVVVDEAAAALNRDVERLGTEYGLELARQVTDLYHARLTLIAERDTYATRPIREQVNHELRIAEIDAQLDALCDGALTRASQKEP